MWLQEDDPDAVDGMLRHAYGLDASTAVKDPGPYFYLRLFTVASKYDVPTLLKEAVRFVKAALASNSSASWFPDVVYQIYEELPTHHGELRAVVSRICYADMSTLLKTQQFRKLLMDVPALAVDAMDIMNKKIEA